MKYEQLAQSIIKLKEADLKLREELLRDGQLSDGYHPVMEQLHRINAAALGEIIETIGYPTVDKVGKEASAAAWLVIQHAIGQPPFMKKCRDLLEMAVGVGEADPLNLAYLSDRIAFYEDRPQRYGTQFDWDENGEMSPHPCDDVKLVNERRKAIGLNTLEAQTTIMRRRAMEENELPPADWAERRKAFVEWKRKTGWTE
ncbi:MAG: DUF6624 domain-containing protein [Bacteroidota bacterium]